MAKNNLQLAQEKLYGFVAEYLDLKSVDPSEIKIFYEYPPDGPAAAQIEERPIPADAPKELFDSLFSHPAMIYFGISNRRYRLDLAKNNELVRFSAYVLKTDKNIVPHSDMLRPASIRLQRNINSYQVDYFHNGGRISKDVLENWAKETGINLSRVDDVANNLYALSVENLIKMTSESTSK